MDKKRFFNFFFWNFRETTRHFSLRSQNSEYPWIFQVTGTNQNARKLLSTDLVNTNFRYSLFTKSCIHPLKVYWEVTKWPVPSWPDSSIGGALHLCKRWMNSNPVQDWNFQAFIPLLLNPQSQLQGSLQIHIFYFFYFVPGVRWQYPLDISLITR